MTQTRIILETMHERMDEGRFQTIMFNLWLALDWKIQPVALEVMERIHDELPVEAQQPAGVPLYTLKVEAWDEVAWRTVDERKAVMEKAIETQTLIERVKHFNAHSLTRSQWESLNDSQREILQGEMWKIGENCPRFRIIADREEPSGKVKLTMERKGNGI